MYKKLTRAPSTTHTPAPDRHERKSLISNQPDRDSIEFLIDTAAIRNDPNPFNNSQIYRSNRHKTGLLYVPHHGAIRQSARVPGTGRRCHIVTRAAVLPTSSPKHPASRILIATPISRNAINSFAINADHHSNRNNRKGSRGPGEGRTGDTKGFPTTYQPQLANERRNTEA